LADAMIANQVDLVVIEGMGRVIHTNLHAKFKCDVLKVWISYLSCLFFNIRRDDCSFSFFKFPGSSDKESLVG
jgi:hypothetical protein